MIFSYVEKVKLPVCRADVLVKKLVILYIKIKEFKKQLTNLIAKYNALYNNKNIIIKLVEFFY